MEWAALTRRPFFLWSRLLMLQGEAGSDFRHALPALLGVPRSQEEVVLAALAWFARDKRLSIEPIRAKSLRTQQLESFECGCTRVIWVGVDLDQHRRMRGTNHPQSTLQD